ncbi:MAG: PD-(D/E)XK nuclease family protein [Spirochaetales bacterium]|nr:PD-(D/E)XK nuclease family protein [Spirochaetales bacterium]
METILKRIEEELPLSDSVFVFPSEVAAAWWRRTALTHTGGKVLRSDRFISWDHFKEEAFALRSDKLPVNLQSRAMFAASLLSENSPSGKLFSSLIFPEFCAFSRNFVGSLINILPRLSHFWDTPGAELIGTDLKGDLVFLTGQYEKFLELNGLYEPGTLQLKPGNLKRRYFICFPELIEDFEAFSRDLQNLSWVTILESPADLEGSLQVFDSALEEVRFVVDRIESLFSAGVPVHEIAITLPGGEAWEDLLKDTCGLRGIPITFRSGKALGSYRPVSLFRQLKDCRNQGFHIESLKSLFLSKGFPWKEDVAGKTLIDFGIRHHCTQNYKQKGKNHDLWLKKLSGDKYSSLRNFYRSFSGGIAAITDAKTFSDLRSGVQRFVNTFLDTSTLDQRALKAFQGALDLLNGLCRAEGKLKGLGPVPVMPLWLLLLQKKIYVPQDKGPGIPVFPYRVSAGIYPRYHFIPGASQDSTTVAIDPFPFLRDDEKTRLTTIENNLTDKFLTAYSRSGQSVWITSSKTSPGGPELPPPLYVAEKKTVTSVTPVSPERIPVSPEERERRLWIGEDRAVPGVYHWQKKGLSRISGTAFTPKGIDFTANQIGNDVLRNAVMASLKKDDELKISPTSLEAYWACPFSFLLQQGLSLGEEEYGEIFSDPPTEGSLMHEVLKEFFEWIKETGGGFHKSGLEAYKDKISEIFEDLTSPRERAGWDLLPPAWNTMKDQLLEYLMNFLEQEAEEFEGWEPLLLEEMLATNVDSVVLHGRIDRLSGHEGNFFLIDYKRTVKVSVADLRVEEGVLRSLQIPCYLYLLRENGWGVEGAAYYDLRKAAYKYLAKRGRKPLSSEEMNEAVEVTIQAVRDMAGQLGAGDFRIPEQDCGGCSLRGICRDRFVIRSDG